MSGFTLDPSAAEFSRDLDAAQAELQSGLVEASAAAAKRSADAMRARYNALHARRSGRASSSFRSTGGKEPTVAFGGADIPYMLGQNFGSVRYPQFPRQARPDHFAISAVLDQTPPIVAGYGKAMDGAMRKAF